MRLIMTPAIGQVLAIFGLALLLTSTEAAPKSRQSSSSPLNCTAIYARSEYCMRAVVLINEPNITIPLDEPSFDREYCSLVEKRMTCIRSMRKCMRPFPRTIMDIAFRGVKKMMKKDICRSKVTRQTTIDSLSCFEPSDLPEISKLVNIVVMVMQAAAKKEQNSILSYTCCGYHQFREKVTEIEDQICNSRQRKQKGEFVSDFLNAIFGDALDMICGGQFTNLDTCSKSYAAGLEEVKEMASRPQNGTDYPGIITSFLSLLTALEGDVV